MKKILLTITVLTMVAVGCGTPKVEVQKARESDGVLLQASYTIFVHSRAVQYLDERSLVFLTDSYDIDIVGNTYGTYPLGPTLVFPNNATLVDFDKTWKAVTNEEFTKTIYNKNNELWNQVKAVFSLDKTKFNKDQGNFVNYCIVESIKSIIDDVDFNRIARMYQGKEYEAIDNKKSLMPRTYRHLIVDLYGWRGDEVGKAKLDVMISDACDKNGNGIYYDDVVNFILGKYKEIKDVVAEGPFRDFVK